MILFFIMTIWPFFLKKGKMTSLGKVPGFWWLLQVPGIYCPVLLLRRFLSRGVHFNDSYLFCKVSHTKSGYRLRNQKLTYSHARQLVRKQLKAVHLNPADYGLHSMRSGGASLAASLGLPDRLIMRQGGWKSANSQHRYIKESRDSLLSITRAFHF